MGSSSAGAEILTLTKADSAGHGWAMKLTGLVVVLACALGAVVWWVSANSGGASQLAGVGETASQPLPPPRTYPPASRMPLPGPDQPYHGVAWQIHGSSGCVEQARAMLGQIADLGADTVLISNAGYQEHAGSESFKIDPAVTPTHEQWQDIFKIAHDNGLRVMLMPIILLSDPRGTEWRGVIYPPSWDDWFEQYTKFILHFARIAAEGKVEVFMVGSELVSTETFTDRWKRVIADVRPVFPGKLSYSSNWDHYKVIEFWGDLDLVGMTNYYKLSSEPNPSLDALVEAWKPIQRGLVRWQEKVGKPLLFTEAGWCSQEGASIEPWNYYYKQQATAGGLEEQRRCYRAFMDTWHDAPQVGGVIWWEWTPDNGGSDDYNYTPKGKPAEGELRDWFKTIRQARQQPGRQPPKTAVTAPS